VVILSVGRAVPKKGYHTLITALGRLRDLPGWRLRHVGGGPLLPALKAGAAKAGIAERIEWLGSLPQEKVLAEYRRADIFVLASEIAPDGDRDGLPNVLMEAQSQRLAVVATGLQGIMELVVDEETGLLAAEADASDLASKLKRLIEYEPLRRRNGEAGFWRVRAQFSHRSGIDDLARRFRA
jgi:glycosyltransferase involved in cell wall biosynthesis